MDFLALQSFSRLWQFQLEVVVGK